MRPLAEAHIAEHQCEPAAASRAKAASRHSNCDPAMLIGDRPGGRGWDGGDRLAALQPIPRALYVAGLVGNQVLG